MEFKNAVFFLRRLLYVVARAAGHALIFKFFETHSISYNLESAYPNPGTGKLNCKLHLVELVCKNGMRGSLPRGIKELLEMFQA